MENRKWNNRGIKLPRNRQMNYFTFAFALAEQPPESPESPPAASGLGSQMTFPILSLIPNGSERSAISRTETFVVTLRVVASKPSV
jgi:hypothetical protein